MNRQNLPSTNMCSRRTHRTHAIRAAAFVSAMNRQNPPLTNMCSRRTYRTHTIRCAVLTFNSLSHFHIGSQGFDVQDHCHLWCFLFHMYISVCRTQSAEQSMCLTGRSSEYILRAASPISCWSCSSPSLSIPWSWSWSPLMSLKGSFKLFQVDWTKPTCAPCRCMVSSTFKSWFSSFRGIDSSLFTQS